MADSARSISVLIVDDEKMIRNLLGETLEAIGYSVMTASDFDQTVETLKTENVDVVITDIMMPGKSGVDLIRLIKQDYPQIPVLAISGKGISVESLYEAGADGFLAKPFRIGVVENMIEKTLLRYDIRRTKPVSIRKKVLVVDDEPSIISTLVDSLEALGYQAIGAGNGNEALEIIGKDNLDLVITDIRMPEKNGIDLLHEIKDKRPDLPVVIITAYPLAYPPEQAIKEGADGYIAKPFRINQIDTLLAKILYNYDSHPE